MTLGPDLSLPVNYQGFVHSYCLFYEADCQSCKTDQSDFESSMLALNAVKMMLILKVFFFFR